MNINWLLIKDKKQNKIFWKEENISFLFLGTKIKIHYIFKKKTYLTFILVIHLIVNGVKSERMKIILVEALREGKY
jgi:hypothetical protein